VDTSAIIAVLLSDDRRHRQAREAFERLAERRDGLLTTSYVLLEAYALLGRRIGIEAVRLFREEFAPLLDVVWIDASTHERGLDLLLRQSDRHLTLVDAVSFVVVRDERVDELFAFDRDFEAEGFPILP
jgi:predicted nucleic acid-binding protein